MKSTKCKDVVKTDIWIKYISSMVAIKRDETLAHKMIILLIRKDLSKDAVAELCLEIAKWHYPTSTGYIRYSVEVQKMSTLEEEHHQPIT